VRRRRSRVWSMSATKPTRRAASPSRCSSIAKAARH
jgi:hypothetical protein